MRAGYFFAMIEGNECMRTALRGQATLSFIILVGGVLIEIAIAGSLVAYFLNNAGLSERLAARAYTAALSGVRDAQIKITRNKELVTITPMNYTFVVGSDSALVIIGRTTGFDETYQYTVTAQGMAATRVRTLVATIVVHQDTGLLALQSVREQ